VHDFHKVLSYAFLYAALNKSALEDLAVSIIETRYPRGSRPAGLFPMRMKAPETARPGPLFQRVYPLPKGRFLKDAFRYRKSGPWSGNGPP
jgi:hypothetical protein